MASTVGPTIETLPASNAKTNTKGSTTKLHGPAATYPASTPTISAEPIAHRACAVVTGPRGVSDTLTDAQAATRTDAAAMATRGFGQTLFGHAATDRPSAAARRGSRVALAPISAPDGSVTRLPMMLAMRQGRTALVDRSSPDRRRPGLREDEPAELRAEKVDAEARRRSEMGRGTVRYQRGAFVHLHLSPPLDGAHGRLRAGRVRHHRGVGHADPGGGLVSHR